MLVVGPADLTPKVRAVAHRLADERIGPGDRLGVVTPELDGPGAEAGQAAALAVVVGCLGAGVVPVLIHPMLTPRERTYIAEDAGCSLVLRGSPQLLAFTAGAGGPSPVPEQLIGRPMHYTSGTTGQPKGVHAPLTPEQAARYWDDEVAHWGFTADDVTLVHSPLCHSAPLRFALGTLQAGGRVALVGKFEPARIARAMTELAPTTAFVVPAQLQQLLDLPGGPPPSSYRMLVHAGSACPPGVKRATHQWLGAERVTEFYSSTEGHFTTCSGPEWEDRPGTVGRARAGRIVTADPDGRVWCEPPPFARFEYWNAPGKTTAAWRDTATGRAFTVGDLGRLDDDGYLFLDGRREDLIVSGGVNVYPAEVEGIMSGCPGVSAVVVYALPDDRWGQRVCAAYTGDVDQPVLAGWAAEQLAAYKRPKTWTRMSELPRNSMGKIVRSELPGATGGSS